MLPSPISRTSCRLLFALLLMGFAAQAQTDTAAMARQLMEEASLLYHAEKASWHASDILTDIYPRKASRSGGYVAYVHGDSATCVFLSADKKPTVLVSMTFDTSYSEKTARVDDHEREPTEQEERLFMLRKKAIELITKDNSYTVPENSRINLVPVVRNGEGLVYIFTAPVKTGKVILGNDYLLRFDSRYKLTERIKFHTGPVIIPVTDNKLPPGSTVHSHAADCSATITATDICTLMLYKKSANWKQHMVISADYISVWDCVTNQLRIYTREVWDRMEEEQKKNTETK